MDLSQLIAGKIIQYEDIVIVNILWFLLGFEIEKILEKSERKNPFKSMLWQRNMWQL